MRSTGLSPYMAETEQKEEKMKKELEKVYDPKTVEERIYDLWRSSGSFKAFPEEGKKPFCIVMPPPNVTGQLHMGHALNMTL